MACNTWSTVDILCYSGPCSQVPIHVHMDGASKQLPTSVSIHCVQGSYHLHDSAATIHFSTENSDQVWHYQSAFRGLGKMESEQGVVHTSSVIPNIQVRKHTKNTWNLRAYTCLHLGGIMLGHKDPRWLCTTRWGTASGWPIICRIMESHSKLAEEIIGLRKSFLFVLTERLSSFSKADWLSINLLLCKTCTAWCKSCWFDATSIRVYTYI